MNIFVGNLSRDVTEDDLRAAFEAFGQLKSVAVIKDKITRESRGFGFVEMSNQAEAQAAIAALNGTDLKGRRMNVNEARPREERPAREGFGGGSRRSFDDRRGSFDDRRGSFGDRRGDDRGRRSGGSGGRRDDRRSW